MLIKNKRILGLATTAFFNDRGCHVRIERVIEQLFGNETMLMCYAHGRERQGIRTVRAGKGFIRQDIIGFSFLKLLFDMILLKSVMNAVQKKDFDIILAFTHEAGIIAMIMRAMFRIPYMLDYQGSLYEEITVQKHWMKFRPIGYIIRCIEEMVNRKAELIIFNTEFSFNNADAGKKLLIDDRKFPQDSIRIASFRENSERIIVWMGLMNKAQGYDAMERIMMKSLGTIPDIKFVIVGFPEESARNRMSRYGNSVIFTGRVPFDSVPSILEDADICISTKEQATEGGSKLHLYARYCRNILALRSNAASEILSSENLCGSEDEIYSRMEEMLSASS